MPKVVNHEERRREVTEVSARLVIEHGRTALTVRNVAEAAGYSTTVVSHYFLDMAELFFETYNFAASRSALRLKRVLDADPSDIVGFMEALLPLDKQRSDDWVVWFAFWSEALTSPRFAIVQRDRARNAVTRIEKCLAVLRQQKAISPGIDIKKAADRLAALIPGIASEAAFDPQKWPAERQRAVLRSELSLIGIH